MCVCLPGITSEKCDRCQPNTTDFFPSCEPCDECTGQWQARINPLRADVEAALELARVMTMTPGPEGVPMLVALIEALSTVRALLDTSQADSELVDNVTALHRQLCKLTNQTQDLFNRSSAVDDEISRLEGEVVEFEDETIRLESLLLELQVELEALSREFGNITTPDLDPQPYLTIAEEARERSANADQLISQNVTSLLSQTEDHLAEYRRELNESELLQRQSENLRVLSDIGQRLSEYEAFLVVASAELCGGALNTSNNGSCGACGGIGCDTCGGSPQCNDLVSMATEAIAVSRQALELAESLRNQIAPRVATLRGLFTNIAQLSNDTLDAAQAALQVQTAAQELFEEVRDLHDNLRRQLLEERIDPSIIEEVEMETLSLALVVNQEEVSEMEAILNNNYCNFENYFLLQFLEILVAINSTVDMIFSRFGVNSTDLARRAESVLERAENAK